MFSKSRVKRFCFLSTIIFLSLTVLFFSKANAQVDSPEIISTTPYDGAEDVDFTYIKISTTFTEPLDIESVDSAQFIREYSSDGSTWTEEKWWGKTGNATLGWYRAWAHLVGMNIVYYDDNGDVIQNSPEGVGVKKIVIFTPTEIGDIQTQGVQVTSDVWYRFAIAPDTPPEDLDGNPLTGQLSFEFRAAKRVEGTIGTDTTLTDAYIVTDNVTVPADKSLAIKRTSATKLKFDETKITVQNGGNLVGFSSDPLEPIYFTRSDRLKAIEAGILSGTSTWSGIEFQDGSTGYLENCLVEYASTIDIKDGASLFGIDNSIGSEVIVNVGDNASFLQATSYTPTSEQIDAKVDGTTFIKAAKIDSVEGVSPFPVLRYYDAEEITGEEDSLRLYRFEDDKWKFVKESAVDGSANKVYVALDNVTVEDIFAVFGGYPYGDVNGSGALNTTDAVLLLQKYVGIITELPIGAFDDPDNGMFAQYVADVNRLSGGVPTPPNTTDAVLALQKYVGIITEFPVISGGESAPSLSLESTNPTRRVSLSLNSKVRASIDLDDAADIYSTEAILKYDAEILTISEVSKTSLTSGSLMVYNDKKAGELRVVLANAVPLSGAGALLNVQFDIAPGANMTEFDTSVKLEKVELNSGYIKTKLMRLVHREFALLQNYPNPFNPETWIPYKLDKTTNVKIRIYDVNGQLIHNIILGEQVPGDYITTEKAAHWTGLNNYGERVSSGIYFYQILTDSKKSQIKKMVILK